MKLTEIEKRRKAKSWSFVQLRNTAGVDDTTLRGQEKRLFPKRKVHARVRQAVARALECDPLELYTVDGYVK